MQAVNRIRGAFAVPRKGETFELRAGLVSQYAFERKEAIQKTIMAMTLGKDVSALFPDVLKNIATGDLDQKKLVYLYLMCVAALCWGREQQIFLQLLTIAQELRKVTSRSVHFSCQHICARLGRPKSPHSRPRYPHHGLHSCRQDG